MRSFFTVLLIIPFCLAAQKLRVNEYDKFIKQRRVEMESLPIMNTDKANVSLNLAASGSSLFLLINGSGWGSSTIDAGNEAIFLFSNDSTVSVKSTGLQTADLGSYTGAYKHQYNLSLADLDALSKFTLIGIRKYGFKDFSDMKVSKEAGERIRKLSLMFVDELKKARIIQTLKAIQVGDIASHIGDSVIFSSKIYRTRYFEGSEHAPTLLDVNPSFNGQLVNVIIWQEDRDQFAKAPEALFDQKEVTIRGVVQLVNNAPQLIIRQRSQIIVTSPISLSEVPFFIGDTVSVVGKSVLEPYKTAATSATSFLHLGAAYPDQLLTVVIDKKANSLANFSEALYTDKDVQVRGKLILNNNRPEILVSNKEQIIALSRSTPTVMKMEETSVAKTPAVVPLTESESNEAISAHFPGGDTAWSVFLQANLHFPYQLYAGEKKTTFASFLVSPFGDISNIRITQSSGKSFDAEVIRVLKLMPKWTPYMLNGKPVGKMVTQKITFAGVETESAPLKSF